MTVKSVQQPVGVFDSGVGGLTVLAALSAQLPDEDFLYLGDTARLPYGTKSADTVVRYAIQAADELVERGVKALIVACNTASAAALAAMRDRYEYLPLIGVIEPGAQAACAASVSGRIAVIATEATVRDGAYQRAITRLKPDAVVSAVACQLFVALAEEGWTSGAVTQAAAERYLRPLFNGSGERPDTLVLGCTHFPALHAVIRDVVGPEVQIVDSARTTAQAACELLDREGLRRVAGTGSTLQFLATDGVARFARVGARFLGRSLAATDVDLIDF